MTDHQLVAQFYSLIEAQEALQAIAAAGGGAETGKVVKQGTVLFTWLRERCAVFWQRAVANFQRVWATAAPNILQVVSGAVRHLGLIVIHHPS